MPVSTRTNERKKRVGPQRCLEGAFSGKSTFVRERSTGGRVLRSQRNVMSCPSCSTDVSDFLQNPQVNRELMDVIESLKSKTEVKGRTGALLRNQVKKLVLQGKCADLSSTRSVNNSENPDVIGVDDSDVI
ncbi:E3 ubiquitin-protein ligase ORTHRUS 2 [Morella rubra]|uniref:E3 ubiquitin-protein ligase ORTHRUS 2 n=1 Tax=Morella rubra TaxID=262757 RepID=A0A6A1ULZ8_9ROSI|nr:E3 ubiquitin-protein ligase ORTHRUS 2 [Morella rubra]